MAEPFIGELRVFSFGFVPKGWQPCNGQTLPINSNQALFSLLGTTYGGDGVRTFALPNLQSRLPLHWGNGLTPGQITGEEAHTLSAGEVPAHTHVVNVLTSPATTGVPAGNIMAAGTTALYETSGGAQPVTLSAATVPDAGGSQAHENRQPFLALNICIALVGIYPSRN